jgi:hypothetical protein
MNPKTLFVIVTYPLRILIFPLVVLIALFMQYETWEEFFREIKEVYSLN